MSARQLQKDVVFLHIAKVLGSLSTCPRREVGCVIVDETNKIIASGYNGTPKGLAHCTNKPCGAQSFSSGQGLATCMAIHAEQNALMQVTDMTKIHTVYTSTHPCEHCLKMLMNTSVKRIVYAEPYDVNPLLVSVSGIEFIHIPEIANG